MPLKTLLVDDSPTVRKAIRYHLMAYGCQDFSEADNAGQALELLRKEHHDLVTFDLMMPTLGGTSSEQAFAQMRREFPETAIVIISSIPYDKVKSEYINGGALAYVVKPLTRFSFEPARQRLRRLFEEFR
ncbi:MAG TPA: response regulator [Candidatus Binataceae bacterium]|jgi:DNA-binding NarL/FixJ family response regulator|nr:response regulator [Candidatus Binataceae bacterium]